MSERASIEREVKLGVWPGYELPDLADLLAGRSAVAGAEQLLEAVYYDTADLRLLRRGVTLRFRRGEPSGDVWTAKLPAGAPAVGLARREITVAGRASSMPERLADLVRGWALGASLLRVARLRTVRRRTTLFGTDDRPLAQLDDDEVSILRGSRVAARFRELEVELADDAPVKLLSRLADRLHDSGAQPVEQIPKLVRALGPPALAPWELDAPELSARPTAAQLVQEGLLAAAGRLADHYAAVVLDEDPEGVHQARVGIRRLRSDVRTFAGLLDRDALRPLRDELGWLGGELGAVRDLDVLLAGLRADAENLDRNDQPGSAELLGRLAGQRATAYGELLEALRSPRCATLLENVLVLVSAPPFASPGAERPAAEVVPTLVRGPLRKLRREGDRLGRSPDDAALHRVRILAKRLRYATDVAAPLAGKRAHGAARALAQLQDVLGEHNDACVALTRLRALAQDATPAGVWASGLLGGLQITRAAERRTQFRAVYRDALAKSRWKWIH